MKKEIDHYRKSGMYDVLRRASFVCLIQACLYTVSTALVLYMRLYNAQTVTTNDTNGIGTMTELPTFSGASRRAERCSIRSACAIWFSFAASCCEFVSASLEQW
ncbi:hypothetical protein DdX_13688 [Ditylenchus destructor]|uniref:Uncharacterized protein n=1 Tax=Ditylenchus destructor TaxID=166010 RepID=A0AAD4MYA8_9BILA|nr:hypothetical protein DdX_13688 [Ditylenchus destructor]